MQTVVFSPSSAGTRQVIVGAWMLMAGKYLELKSVGNLTVPRKVILFFLSFFLFSFLHLTVLIKMFRCSLAFF